jgi:hypothetical protein
VPGQVIKIQRLNVGGGVTLLEQGTYLIEASLYSE